MLQQIRSQMLASKVAAAVQHDAVGCFHVFTAPDNTRVWENMGLTAADIPDDEATLLTEISALNACFASRDRMPRLEVVHLQSDVLISLLKQQDWQVEGEYIVYGCQPDASEHVDVNPGVQTVEILDDSPVSAMQAMMQIGERAFENRDAPLPDVDAALAAQLRWRGMPKVLAYIDGVTVGSGMLTLPINGCSELAGICTLEDYRCRGVATQVVAHLIRIAREREISLAYLTAADEAAARIYVRAGFAPTGLYQTNIGRVSSDT
jgi:GNAT superfamily N-acetyltransferase